MGDPTLSSTSICCSALLKIGGDIISSLTDGSRPANICNQLYATLRDEVMASAPWRFATKQVQIAANGTPPLFEYLYSFTEPNDSLRILTVEAIPWTEQDGLILCNDQGPVNVTYLFQNTDESSWSIQFGEALAYRLAKDLALALVQSVPLAQQMSGEYDKAIAQARSLNAVVGTQQRLIADIWSGARKGYQNPLGAIAPFPVENYD